MGRWDVRFVSSTLYVKTWIGSLHSGTFSALAERIIKNFVLKKTIWPTYLSIPKTFFLLQVLNITPRRKNIYYDRMRFEPQLRFIKEIIFDTLFGYSYCSVLFLAKIKSTSPPTPQSPKPLEALTFYWTKWNFLLNGEYFLSQKLIAVKLKILISQVGVGCWGKARICGRLVGEFSEGGVERWKVNLTICEIYLKSLTNKSVVLT